MPICGLAKSSSRMPTARSIPRAAARSIPSVTSRVRGFRSAGSGGLRHRWPPACASATVCRCGRAGAPRASRGRGGRTLAPTNVPTRDGKRADSREVRTPRWARADSRCGPRAGAVGPSGSPLVEAGDQSWRPPRRGRAGRGEPAVAADVRLAALERGRPAQRAQDVVRGVLGHLHQRVPLVDLDRADVAAGQARLVGQRAHDVLRTHAARAAGVDEQPGRARLRRPGARRRATAPARDARRAPGRPARALTTGMSSASSGAPATSWASPTAAAATSTGSKLGGELDDHRADGVERAPSSASSTSPSRRARQRVAGAVQPGGAQVGGRRAPGRSRSAGR